MRSCYGSQGSIKIIYISGVLKVSHGVVSLLLTINQKVNNILKRLRRMGFCPKLKAADQSGRSSAQLALYLFYDPHGALRSLFLVHLITTLLEREPFYLGLSKNGHRVFCFACNLYIKKTNLTCYS